jgi:hypothetical protein
VKGRWDDLKARVVDREVLVGGYGGEGRFIEWEIGGECGVARWMA